MIPSSEVFIKNVQSDLRGTKNLEEKQRRKKLRGVSNLVDRRFTLYFAVFESFYICRKAPFWIVYRFWHTVEIGSMDQSLFRRLAALACRRLHQQRSSQQASS
jgi:hypothetical protein